MDVFIYLFVWIIFRACTKPPAGHWVTVPKQQNYSFVIYYVSIENPEIQIKTKDSSRPLTAIILYTWYTALPSLTRVTGPFKWHYNDTT